MFVACGRTFIFRGANGPIAHLWAVLTEPCGDPPEVVIVSFTTLRAHSDTTVILNVGDHPFIRHPTTVRYSDAKVISVASLNAALASGRATLMADLDAGLLRRIQQGLMASPYTVLRIREYCGGKFAD